MKNHITGAILTLALALLASACGEKLSSEGHASALFAPGIPTEAKAIVTFITPATSPPPSPSKTSTPLLPSDRDNPTAFTSFTPR